jgi:hypothetical protein
MKKSWMNKLIELLNEYDDWMVSWYEEYFTTEWLFVTNAGQWFREEFILGKRYWFIKWLLDNDKIDLEKLDEKAERKPLYSFTDDDWSLWIKLFEVYEGLLMLLSIQDSPIEFLCSMLK